MTHNPTRSPLDQDDFDLSNIFIGREQQVILFNFYLQHWKSSLAQAVAANDTPMLTAPSPHNKIQGLLILLYGRGGFGKSTLLRHYRNMLLQENALLLASRVLPSEIIDWETIPESRRSLFTLSQAKEIDASSYFTMLCTQLANALGKKVDDFKQYQRAAQGVKDAQQQANKLIESLRGDERFASLRGVAGTGILNLLRLVPHADIVLQNQQIADAVKGYAGAGVEVAAEQVIHLRARLQQKLGTRLTDYLEPDLKLGLSLGYDLRDFAKNFPLLIFFDTYEVIDEGDNLLRIIMGAAGQRVGWVIAGRDNLWAGLEQRLRNRGIETGYKELVPASTGKEIDFNAGGIGAFTPSDIAAYFAEIRARVGTYADLPPVTADEIDAIWDVTKGIPLTVRIAAAIYLANGNVANITKSVQGKRDIVDQMVRRYLLHVRDNEQDRAKLYGLALLRRPDQPESVSAALGLTPEQAKSEFTFTNELSRLHRRYSFIFTEKEEPALHQEVRHFLRLWLLEHRTNPEIIAINQQLQAAHEQCFQQLEQHRPYSTLKERLQDDEWVNSYLDLVEQHFWLDPVAGLRSLLPFMLAAAIYRREANEEAADIGTFFAETISSPYRNWWLWADESLTYTTSSVPSTEELHGLEELEKLLSQQLSIFTPPL
nr:hypothetical protein [Ktedonobacteraceae bacterium]